MKKKIFGGIAIMSIAAVTAFNVNFGTQNDISAITLANVEALAQEGDAGGGMQCRDEYPHDTPCNIYKTATYCPCGW